MRRLKIVLRQQTKLHRLKTTKKTRRRKQMPKHQKRKRKKKKSLKLLTKRKQMDSENMYLISIACKQLNPGPKARVFVFKGAIAGQPTEGHTFLTLPVKFYVTF